MINSANRIFEDAEPKLYSDGLRQKKKHIIAIKEEFAISTSTNHCPKEY